MTLQREQAHSLRSERAVRTVKPRGTKAKPRVVAGQNPNREHEGYLIRELQHLLRNRIETRLRTKGLWMSFPHSMVLMTLREQPGLSGAQLARCLGVTAQTMNGLLVPLEEKGFIVREHDPENARVLKSVLTPSGQRMLQECLQEASAVFGQMLGTLSERERSDFRHLLRRCINALSQSTERAPPAKRRRASQAA